MDPDQHPIQIENFKLIIFFLSQHNQLTKFYKGNIFHKSHKNNFEAVQFTWSNPDPANCKIESANLDTQHRQMNNLFFFSNFDIDKRYLSPSPPCKQKRFASNRNKTLNFLQS